MMHRSHGRYGVPGADALKFEEVFQKEVPDLFHKDPKLLFKLCTMVTPTKLKEGGVRVNHTLQHPGEFIVTFPQVGSFSAVSVVHALILWVSV